MASRYILFIDFNGSCWRFLFTITLKNTPLDYRPSCAICPARNHPCNTILFETPSFHHKKIRLKSTFLTSACVHFLGHLCFAKDDLVTLLRRCPSVRPYVRTYVHNQIDAAIWSILIWIEVGKTNRTIWLPRSRSRLRPFQSCENGQFQSVTLHCLLRYLHFFIVIWTNVYKVREGFVIFAFFYLSNLKLSKNFNLTPSSDDHKSITENRRITADRTVR